MKIFIMTRFSVYDYKFKGFVDKVNLDEIEYKNRLFSEDRLNYKFKSFEMVTLPSIVNQTNQNFVWYIYASTYLPEKYKTRLNDLIKHDKNIICIYVENLKELYHKKDFTDEKYCTMRIDDDDGLSPTFLENLYNNYRDEENNTVISYVNGRKFTIDNDKIIYGNTLKYKKIALGLCVIGNNIYSCGCHSYLDKEYNVVYNETPEMYMLNCSEFCDTKRKL